MAQDPNAEPQGFNYTNELARAISLPKTPESAAFAQYGNTPVNFFNGTPSIRVPIYTHKGREISLPISLTYDASGIKVNQLPTTVGLGWNLALGGRITRIVNGNPDDYNVGTTPVYESWYNTNQVYQPLMDYLDDGKVLDINRQLCFQTGAEANAYLRFLDDIHKGKYETQPDLYSLNVAGISETFVIDPETKVVIPLKNPRLRITYNVTGGSTLNTAQNTITQFTVVSDDGTTYTFDLMETAKTTTDTGDENLYGKIKYYNTGWFLTEIRSPFDKDIYTFIYSDYASRNDIPSYPITEVTDHLVNSNETPSSFTGYITSETSYFGAPKENPRKSIHKVLHNGLEIVRITPTIAYEGGPDTAVETIEIFDAVHSGGSATLIKRFDLQYSYFKTAPDINPTQAPLEVRLKLDAIEVQGRAEVEQQYFFEYYDPEALPSLTSHALDYLGYYNGPANENQDLFAKAPNNFTNGFFGGGNRGPNFTHARKGLLKKITYPTKGYSIFNYEPAGFAVQSDQGQNVWTVLKTFTHSSTTLPSYDAQQCNLMHLDGDITPDVGFSTAFEITPDAVGPHKIEYDAIYLNTEPPAQLQEFDEKAYLIKLDNPNQVVDWHAIFDSNCMTKDVSIIWAMDGNWQLLPPSQRIVNLEAGWYQLVLPVHNIHTEKTVDIYQVDTQATTSTEEVPTSGIRVSDIVDYTTDNTIARIKTYDYEGVRLNIPDVYYFTNEHNFFFHNGQNGAIDFGFEIREVMHRPSSFLNGDKPAVGYRRVKETVRDFSGEANHGSTIYTYDLSRSYTYESGTYYQRIPNEAGSGLNFSFDRRAGAQNGKTLPGMSETVNFEDSRVTHSVSGAYLASNGLHNYYYPVIDPQGVCGGVTLSLISSSINALVSHPEPEAPNPKLTIPENFKQEIARLVLRPTYMFQRRGGNPQYLVQSEDTPVGTLQIETQKVYTDNDLLQSEIRIDSQGDTLLTKLSYPFEDLSRAGHTLLVGKNRINTPYQTKTFRNDELLTTQQIRYDTSTGLERAVQWSVGENPIEERLIFESYDTAKNITETRLVGQRPTVYLWGYDYRYLIAKIENASYSQVLAALPVSYNALQQYTGHQLTSIFSDLRTNLPGAMVTGYTYRPSIGMTAQYQPNGLNTSYVYDSFNRLSKVRDHNNYLIETLEYNTLVSEDGSSPQQYNNPYTATAISATAHYGSTPYYTGNVNQLTGGSGSFTYHWYYSVDNGIHYSPIETTQSNTFTLYFNCDSDGEFAGQSIVFWCRITDNDPNNTAASINVYSQSQPVNCGF
ncbi:MAG: hypothetical protein MRY57_00875 [Candidatus Pacebacteria bacterium]|nr:hypothetical protein [Candidatus Paceibacterota bacterium]